MPSDKCYICMGSKTTMSGDPCVCGDGGREGMIAGLRQRVWELVDENADLKERLTTALELVRTYEEERDAVES